MSDRWVIVPNKLRDEINAQLDKALEGMDEEAVAGRSEYFAQLLAFFDDHGRLPDFEIAKREDAA